MVVRHLSCCLAPCHEGLFCSVDGIFGLFYAHLWNSAKLLPGGRVWGVVSEATLRPDRITPALNTEIVAPLLALTHFPPMSPWLYTKDDSLRPNYLTLKRMGQRDRMRLLTEAKLAALTENRFK